ncbi:hypothetical protein T484DRAFT_1804113 [Baffinella frigidus]|nr:hypothetical protein T484DRAFT_1804113 [Cryptophyta sp. CCMP2293]
MPSGGAPPSRASANSSQGVRNGSGGSSLDNTLNDTSLSTIGGSKTSTPGASPLIISSMSVRAGGAPAPAAPGPRPGAYTHAGEFGASVEASGYSTAYDSDKSENYASSVGSYSGPRGAYRSDKDDGYSSSDSSVGQVAIPPKLTR